MSRKKKTENTKNKNILKYFTAIKIQFDLRVKSLDYIVQWQ